MRTSEETQSQARMPRVSGALLRTQPDDRLAQLAGEGSRAAFEELAERYRSRLVAFAGSIAPPGDADDVVQDSMLKAWMALSRGDEPESPKSWLYTIVRNTALNHRRAYRPHAELDETIDGVEQPPQAAERQSRFRSLVSGMRALPASQREAIVQRELEGRGHDEIAGKLGVSPAAVRQLIFRARETLRAGAAAVMPLSLLRLVSMPAAEQASAGLGASTAKLGVTAVVAAGLLVGGDKVVEQVEGGKPAQQAEAAPESNAGSVAPDAAAFDTPGGSARASQADARKASADLGAASVKRETPVSEQRFERPPPRPSGQPAQRPPGSQPSTGQQHGTAPNQGAGGGGATSGGPPPPPGGGGGGGHHGAQVPPPPAGQLPPG